MHIREIYSDSSELVQFVKNLTDENCRLASMYVQEPHSNGKRTLETIMLSGAEMIRIHSDIEMEFPSLISVVPSELYEREISEMSGVMPSGYSTMKPLRLRYVRDGEYPLQKIPNSTKEKRQIPIPHNGMVGDGIFEVPVGPIHAGVIEPNHFRFSVAGEPILMLRAHLGFTHKGIEKLMEQPVGKDMTHLTERISGDNSVAHSLAYLQAMERDTDVPERARYIRTVLAELERIYCHLGGISGIAMDTALSVPAARGLELREMMLRLNERISGSRQLRNMLRPGGLRKDIDSNGSTSMMDMMEKLRSDVDDLTEMMRRSPSFTDRAESTGTLSLKQTEDLGTVGPIARASGVDYDVRKTSPYEMYDRVEFKVPVRTGGDVYSRLMVKKEEVQESIGIVTQCLELMESGPILTKTNEVEGFSIGMVESPRGETIHCVNVVNGKIWRYKIRDASFLNWPALEYAVLGDIIPDFPLINKSFDLSCSGNDL